MTTISSHLIVIITVIFQEVFWWKSQCAEQWITEQVRVI